MLERFPPNATLVVIDVQQGFDEPVWGDRNNPGAESNIARLLAAWRSTGRPVAFVRHDSQLPTSSLRPGQPGNAIKPVVAPSTGDVIYGKTVNSAFIGTTLEADLRAAGVSALVVVGLTTPHCVSTTTRMAGNLGFDTYVVSDATAAFAGREVSGRRRPPDDVHAAALSDLHGEFAAVVDTEAVLRAAVPTRDGLEFAAPAGPVANLFTS